MKVQCDVCGKEAAAVFCTADEAALCQNCDNRIHSANKLASKHTRFSLINLQFKDYPRCDICQERQALFFCQEDRALLCRECDFPIHEANELTKKHNRFLLTGVKLSADALSIQDGTAFGRSEPEAKIKALVDVAVDYRKMSVSNCSESSSIPLRCNELSQPQLSDSTSNISEYFMETLPGWHVEDLLDSSCHYGFYEVNYAYKKA